MEFDEIITWILDHWYIFFIIIIVFIYSKYKDKQTVGNLTLKNMFFIVEIGLYFMIIYFIQTRLFSEHNYFLLALPLWVLIWAIAVNSILSQNDVYMVETSLMGEPFYDVINGETIISLSTRNRILIMDRTYYNEKSHIGEINNPLLQISNIVKFCDYFDSKTGIFYHSVYPALQNINFYARIGAWLKLKEDLPKIVDENIGHTFLEGHKLSVKMENIEKNYAHQLKGIRNLTEQTPFDLRMSLKEYLEIVKSAKKVDSSEKIETENKPIENKTNDEGD